MVFEHSGGVEYHRNQYSGHYVIYINDLPDGLENIFKCIQTKAKSLLNLVPNYKRDIFKIKDWCDKWSMCLNRSKCKVMNSRRTNPGGIFHR